jgi:iron complex transport system ATP-binding protein
MSVTEYVETGATQTVQSLGPASARTKDRVATLLGQLGLSGLSDRAISVCSQGERARARLARALVAHPALLLLDEPAAGLDLPGRADLLAALESTAVAEPALASVVVAHHLEELPATTTHVALLRDGHVIAQGGMALLGDSDALTRCFGREVSAFSHAGRWFAISP